MRIPLVVAALLLAFPSFSSAATLAPTSAPPFHLRARTGFATLDSLAGHVVVVDFWASWCVPCQKSFPWLGNLETEYGSKGLKVVAINLDKSRANADAFLMKNPARFTVAFDPTGKTAEEYAVSAMPSTILIGADGMVAYRHAGFDPKETQLFEQEIQKALGAASGGAQ